MPANDDEFIPTRASLLSRLKDWNDQESWKDFFDTYWKMLYSVARRSGLREAEAQDIVQETIMAVAKKMPDFHYDPALGSFKSWLMLIIRRRVIDFLRKRGREPLQQDPGSSGAFTTGAQTDRLERIADPDAGQIDRIYEEEWQKGVFEAALQRVKRKVDPKQMQLFDCYAIRGWPVEEVAANFNVTTGLVYTAKSRVTALLKEEVERLEQKMA